MTVITIHVYTQGLRVHKAENMSTHTEEDQIVDERQSAAIRLANLLKLDGNKQCADCGAAAPQWASCNLGIFLCINCAGTHRNTLGTYISKIKSVRLDSWTMEEVDIVAEMGNVKANAVYEANLPEAFKRPQHDDTYPPR